MASLAHQIDASEASAPGALAEDWLAAQLADGKPHSRDALLFAGTLAGYAENDLKRAAIRLGVTAEPVMYCLRGGQCGRMVLWRLVPDALSTAVYQG